MDYAAVGPERARANREARGHISTRIAITHSGGALAAAVLYVVYCLGQLEAFSLLVPSAEGAVEGIIGELNWRCCLGNFEIATSVRAAK